MSAGTTRSGKSSDSFSGALGQPVQRIQCTFGYGFRVSWHHQHGLTLRLIILLALMLWYKGVYKRSLFTAFNHVHHLEPNRD